MYDPTVNQADVLGCTFLDVGTCSGEEELCQNNECKDVLAVVGPMAIAYLEPALQEAAKLLSQGKGADKRA